MKTSGLVLVALAAGLLCVGDAVGQDEQNVESDAALLFEDTLAKAEDENVAVIFNLGVMYANGYGLLEGDVEAYAWFNVAAANGGKKFAESRDKIKTNMTPEQIAEGQNRSREIMKFISKNNPPKDKTAIRQTNRQSIIERTGSVCQ